MLITAQILLSALILLILYDLILTVPFILAIAANKKSIIRTDERYPKVAVILSLRGADPFLGRCIEGLLEQDYPDYSLHLVVDHINDPALQILQDARFQNHGSRLNVQILEKPPSYCSLKCASQIQAIRNLDPAVEIIAFVDADTQPHHNWLRNLVSPLLDADTGATTGNRWYLPDHHPSFGTIVRYVWNATAMIAMFWLRIPWGGTMAVKRIVFEKTDILDHWQNALCEDTSLSEYLKKIGLRLKFVPGLIMFNHENCTLSGFLRWEVRQLLNNRLHHPLWYSIVIHAFGMVAIVVANLALLIIALASGNQLVFNIVTLALAIYGIILILLLTLLEIYMRRIARERGIATNWLSPRAVLMILTAIPVAHLLHPIIVTKALMANFVEWRGVKYRIDGPGKIKLVNYEPYVTSRKSNGTNDSL